MTLPACAQARTGAVRQVNQRSGKIIDGQEQRSIAWWLNEAAAILDKVPLLLTDSNTDDGGLLVLCVNRNLEKANVSFCPTIPYGYMLWNYQFAKMRVGGRGW